MDSTLPNIEKVHTEITKYIEEYNLSALFAIEQSHRRFQILRDEINTEEREWIANFEEMTQKDILVLAQRQEEVENKIKHLLDLIKNCQTTIEEAKDVATLEFNSTRPPLSRFVPEKFTEPLFRWFEPSDYTLHNKPSKKLVGRITQVHRPVPQPQLKPNIKTTMPVPDTVDVKPIGTIKHIRADSMLYTNEPNHEIWASCEHTRSITVYNENDHKFKKIKLNFELFDMALMSSGDVIATDWDGQRLIRISPSGSCKAICSTEPLRPCGVCVNDRQQVVVGLAADKDCPPIKLVYNSVPEFFICFKCINKISNDPLFHSA